MDGEYLCTGRNREAVPEFAEAAKLFPHDATVHSNFGVSLCVVGEFDRAEQETKLALYLDPTLESAQQLMRMIASDKQALVNSTHKLCKPDKRAVLRIWAAASAHSRA